LIAIPNRAGIFRPVVARAAIPPDFTGCTYRVSRKRNPRWHALARQHCAILVDKRKIADSTAHFAIREVLGANKAIAASAKIGARLAFDFVAV